MSENTPVIAATESTEIKFKDDLVNGSQALRDKHVASRDSATGTVVLGAGWLLDESINPKGLTEEDIGDVLTLLDLGNNAGVHAGTHISTELFKANPDLQTVTMTGPVYKKSTFEATFKREGTSRNVKTGEVSNYKGAIGVGRMNLVSTRTQAEWQGIKQNMRNLAEAAGL